MSVAFPIIAFIGAFVLTFRSLGWGLLAVIAVGYFNGLIRANYLGVYTTFMFDAALLGLYAAFLLGHHVAAARAKSGPIGKFAAFLIGWPLLLSMIPVNDLLVQFVALRATVWFLPVLVIATQLTRGDLAIITRGIAILNLCALLGGLYIYFNGVASLYPVNAVTEIIYRSRDVGEHHRIPSTFLSAHAYGGAMLLSLPFLLDRVIGVHPRPWERVLGGLGVAAALAGIMMCGARQPIVTLGFASLLALVLTRFNTRIVLVVLALVAGGVLMALSNARFQRASTIHDTEYVSRRIQGSANEAFLTLLVDYPLGAGMGSSVGTSIPFFLADRAPRQIGMENEYCRILVDQGWIGLAGWLVFLTWLFVRPPPPRLTTSWGLGAVLMYALCLTIWATAFIGTGTLAAIPSSVLLLSQMGILVAARSGGALPGAEPAPVEGRRRLIANRVGPPIVSSPPVRFEPREG